MKTIRAIPAVLIVAAILVIAGCNNNKTTEISNSDDIEITTATVETQEETSATTQETIFEATETPRPTSTPIPTATSTPTPEVTESSEATQPSTESTQVQEQASAENVAPTATSAPVATATQAPPATPDPTSTPTPAPTATPTPEPVVFDIDQSARDNGYEIIDIDMGNGTTQRIYGYYVDMSGLDSMVNDYRESIGLSRLPTDTAHIEEMKIRAAEASIPGYLSHQRPNGSWGSEANIVSGTDVNDCYQRLYNSDGHRATWEDEYATTIYSVGFRRMVFDENTGTWSGGGGATVQYTDYSF